MAISYIYALYCPVERTVRYVGQTSINPKYRLANHIKRSVEEHNNSLHKERWIRRLNNHGLKPLMLVLDSGEWSKDERDAKEIYYIAKYRKLLGTKLTNVLDGGIIAPPNIWKGKQLPVETKQKMSESHKLRWEKIKSDPKMYEKTCNNISAGTQIWSDTSEKQKQNQTNRKIKAQERKLEKDRVRPLIKNKIVLILVQEI